MQDFNTSEQPLVSSYNLFWVVLSFAIQNTYHRELYGIQIFLLHYYFSLRSDLF